MDWFREKYEDDLPLFENSTYTKVFLSEGNKPWEGRPESRVAAVLKELREGPLTTNELLDVSTHRFACEIHQLRQRGFKIRTTRISETQCRYELTGYTPMVSVKKGMQEAYYLSPHWRQKRRVRLEIDHHRCTQCRTKEGLHVHHWVYNLFAEDAKLELQTYCANCHFNIHELSSVKISFPKRVPVCVSEQLKTLVGSK